jgi:ubiquinone/menaquinone biosynthesis C-methylase UbiE
MAAAPIPSASTPADREAHERSFWDEHVPELGACLTEYRGGPDANTAAAVDALEPLHGASVLDFACGAGVSSAWLADRGADVTGLDLSPRSTERARELGQATGSSARFVTGGLDALPSDARFDRILGRYALHHTNVREIGPELAYRLHPGGRAAFVETMATNPVLRIARRTLVGRFGIPRIGTLGEHPLTRADLETLRQAFGDLRLEVAEMAFLRIFDRQVLRWRSERASGVLGMLDDLLLRLPGAWRLSYHQVVVLTRVGA